MAWQSEWLEGPGVKEAEEAEHVALFRSMPSCFAALAAWNWRAAKRAAGAPKTVATPATTPEVTPVPRQDVLVEGIWHVRRSVRDSLDGQRPAGLSRPWI